MMAISSRSALASSGTLGVVVGFSRFFALLYHLGEQRQDFVVAQKRSAVLGAVGDVAVLERGKHEPEGCHAALVGRLHGVFI